MIETNSEQQVDRCPSNTTRASGISLKRKMSCMLSSCRICLSSVFDPASLTCGHRFCEKCLDTYWHLKNKPDFIICPLCRACASDIDFVKKEKQSSTEELRKMFNLSDKARLGFDTSTLCVQISILIPVIYFVLKWLRTPLTDLLSYLQAEV